MSRKAAILFFSVLFAIGLAATWLLLVRLVLRLWDARFWTPTPCTVVSSEVRARRSRDGTTYSVHVVYRYTVNDRTYQANRYDLMGSASSNYHNKLAIVRRYRPGQQAVCYVNPRNPADAVLERRATPAMLFALFPLAIVGFAAAGLVWTLTSQAFPKCIRGVPPWQARADWAEGRIVYSDKPVMLVAWVIALIVNFAVGFVIALFSEQFPAVWLAGLIGAGAMWVAWRVGRRWRKYGESVFELTTRPGAIGGVLAGTLRLQQFVRFDDGMKFVLCCVREVSAGRSTAEQVLWSEEQTVAADGTDTVSVSFYIPPDCSETNPNEGIHWRLEARAADYSAHFEVPVFRVAQDAGLMAAAEQARATRVAFHRPADSPIRVEPSLDGGTEFYFPAGRNAGAAIGLAIFMVAWTVAVAAMILFKAPILLIVVFSAVELVVLAFLFALWFGSTCVTVNRQTIRVVHSALGWRRERTVPVADITGFAVSVGMTAGTTVYYDINLSRCDGKTESVARFIKSKPEADWLAAEMSRCAGIAFGKSK
ncbi:MAG: DUF3592 domain-containing protein [Verrucomicrobiae bacterium]|nr:DUF3592 domain-containing protein [Verrucomicrobiae bacterium]